MSEAAKNADETRQVGERVAGPAVHYVHSNSMDERLHADSAALQVSVAVPAPVRNFALVMGTHERAETDAASLVVEGVGAGAKRGGGSHDGAEGTRRPRRGSDVRREKGTSGVGVVERETGDTATLIREILHILRLAIRHLGQRRPSYLICIY